MILPRRREPLLNRRKRHRAGGIAVVAPGSSGVGPTAGSSAGGTGGSVRVGPSRRIGSARWEVTSTFAAHALKATEPAATRAIHPERCMESMLRAGRRHLAATPRSSHAVLTVQTRSSL